MFYTQSGVHILYLVRILYPVRGPSSAVRSPCFILTGSKLKLTHNLSFYHNASLKRDETCWCAQLLKLLSQNMSIMFDCEKFWASSITEPNRSQSNDRSSIGFDYRRSIDYAGHMKAQLNSKTTPATCHLKTFVPTSVHINFTFCWSSRNIRNL